MKSDLSQNASSSMALRLLGLRTLLGLGGDHLFQYRVGNPYARPFPLEQHPFGFPLIGPAANGTPVKLGFIGCPETTDEARDICLDTMIRKLAEELCRRGRYATGLRIITAPSENKAYYEIRFSGKGEDEVLLTCYPTDEVEHGQQRLKGIFALISAVFEVPIETAELTTRQSSVGATFLAAAVGGSSAQPSENVSNAA